jgi:hypothetical protein
LRRLQPREGGVITLGVPPRNAEPGRRSREPGKYGTLNREQGPWSLKSGAWKTGAMLSPMRVFEHGGEHVCLRLRTIRKELG